MRFLLASLVAASHAAVEDFLCGRNALFNEVTGYLDQAFGRPNDFPSANRRILLGLDQVDAYLQAFGLRVGAGAVGWANLFDALQGCPLPFVAVELAYAMGIWNGTNGLEYGLTSRLYKSLGFKGHAAKAVALARGWRTWFEKDVSSSSMDLQQNFQQICQRLPLQWPHLNQMARVAAAALKCERTEGTSVAELLGCSGQADPCSEMEVQPDLDSFDAFWNQLQEGFLMSPSLQMPYGPLEPYMLQLVAQKSLAQAGDPRADLHLEFGVYQGDSINFLARSLRHQGARIYGFDSFRGLPGAWRDGSEIPGALSFGATSFALPSGQLPKVEENVRLIPGWFNETIPAFVAGLEAAGQEVKIRLLHIDCDMYSSAMQVLFGLAKFLRPGSLLVFDELVNFPYFEREELRALYDFLRAHRWKLRVVHAPWFFVPSTLDFEELYQKDGISEIDLLQAVAFELADA